MLPVVMVELKSNSFKKNAKNAHTFDLRELISNESVEI